MPDYGVMWAQLRSDIALRSDDLAEQIREARDDGDTAWMHDRVTEREEALLWEITMDEMESDYA